MKKGIVLLLFTSLLLSFTSCGNEEVTGETEGGELVALLKTQKWVGEDIYFDDDDWFYDETRITLYFMDNNIGYYDEYNKTQYEPGENEYDTYFTQFTYTVSGNEVLISFTNGTQHHYIYNAGVLESGGWCYIPKDITNSDRESINDNIEKYAPLTGFCGYNLQYSYDKYDKVLRIYGSGDMYNYSGSNQPWHDYDIEKLIIEEGVTSIGDKFLYGVKYYINLDELELPSTLKKIGSYAFFGINVSKLDIPASVTEIGESAFADIYSLLSIYFAHDNKLSTIGRWAFDSTDSKSSPNIYTGYSKGLVIGSNMRSIGAGAFDGCSVGYISFEEGIKEIAGATFMQAEISNTTLELPNSLEKIGSVAFYGGFTTVKLGSGIKEIASEAFVTYQDKGRMYINSKTPPKANSSVITSYDYGFNWTLYVPKGCKNAYSSKSPWKDNFKYIYEDSSLGGNN